VIRCDALIVGGGPGGSTCARILRRAGWDVVVVDRARFPRDKVCAGWLTPEVFRLLELDPADYRSTGLTLQDIHAFQTGVLGDGLIETRYPRAVSYAIRRCEFDDFLLRRARVRVLEGIPVASLRRGAKRWIVNEQIETPVVVGAGGHFCPVARHLRGRADTARPVVAKEAEFRWSSTTVAPAEGPSGSPLPADDAPQLFFCRDLEGYGWCVRKGNYLNIGIGRRDSRDFTSHVRDFVDFLEEHIGLPADPELRWKGHAYLAAGTGTRPVVADGMLLVGDAAGLAYPESGEGIRPAIESGRLAAETLVAASGRHDLETLSPYADALRRLYPPVRPTSPRLRGMVTTIGRVLLRSRTFSRHVLLDRWFLRRV
jgi:flavin-dependent dehydrogenase